MTGPGRGAELASSLAALRGRIERAATASGRDPAELVLIAVSKTRPAADVALLADLGVREFGENRLQEATGKLTELDQLGDIPGLHWHFLGQLQSNKARAAGRSFGTVHSVDRLAVVEPLSRGAAQAQRVVEVFLQVSLDGATGRGGALPADLPALAEAVAQRPETLRLAGLMAVAPQDVPARRAFAGLWTLAEDLRRSHPEATAISAGMSGDMTDAIAEGATHLRIGTALFGSRA